MRTRIKICGLTSPKEAAYLTPSQVDFAGMVLFCEKSRRNITIEEAAEIMKALPVKLKGGSHRFTYPGPGRAHRRGRF